MKTDQTKGMRSDARRRGWLLLAAVAVLSAAVRAQAGAATYGTVGVYPLIPPAGLTAGIDYVLPAGGQVFGGARARAG